MNTEFETDQGDRQWGPRRDRDEGGPDRAAMGQSTSVERVRGRDLSAERSDGSAAVCRGEGEDPGTDGYRGRDLPVSCYGFYTQDADQFRSDLPGSPPRVFDLRTGEAVDISVEDLRAPSSHEACRVSGSWAAWLTTEGNPAHLSLYLADLSTGKARRLVDDGSMEWLTLSEDWLLWLDSKGGLSGFHLRELTKIRVPGVLESGEECWRLEVSGDLAPLMAIARGGDPRMISPNFTPAIGP